MAIEPGTNHLAIGENPRPPELENRPVPPGWCYLCGFRKLHVGHQSPQPETLDRAVTLPAQEATERLGLPDDLRAWRPGHVAAARALAAKLTAWTDVAERLYQAASA